MYFLIVEFYQNSYCHYKNSMIQHRTMHILNNIYSKFISIEIVTESVLGLTTNVTSTSGFTENFGVPLAGIF